MEKRGIRRGFILVMALVMVATSAFAANYTTLRYRDQGSSVKEMQQALVALGYSTGGTDGKFGPTTEKAVRQFQKDNGLTVDGVAGNATLSLLYGKSSGGSASTPTTPPSSTGTATGYFGGNYNTLKYGSQGDRVKLLQQALKDMGFLSGKVDGKFGTGTQLAVTSFQQANGLEADGKAGRKTLQRVEALLEGDTGGSIVTTAPTTAPTNTPAPTGSSGYSVPTRTLRKGYQGEDVKAVQSRLKELGYYTGSVDGKYGSGSMAAVKAFQSAHGLYVDGLAGSGTYKVLFSDSAKPTTGTTATPVPTASPSPTPAPTSSIPTRVLRQNDTGEDVSLLQSRLKALGYYNSLVDGSFGSGTTAAVKAFQAQHGLDADGVAGSGTYAVLFSDKAQTAAKNDTATAAPDQPTATEPSGGWTTLKLKSTGEQVKQLQEALAKLGYPIGVSSESGYVYNYSTVWAVECFQRRNGLTADGVAGLTTLQKLYGGQAVGANTALSSTVVKGVAPGGANLELMQWYADIKAYLQRNPKFTVYEPVSGKQWNMKLYSAGHHADSEPLTAEDTAIMYEVWGNEWSWDEKPVYVRLANGTWVIASMPNMPHLSGSIKDNNFDGHTCVHFPRLMTEVQQNDPKNAARHNRDIRIHWLKLTGEEIPW